MKQKENQYNEKRQSKTKVTTTKINK